MRISTISSTVKNVTRKKEKAERLTSSGNGLISSSRSRATRATSPRAAASRNFSAIPATHLQKKRKCTVIRGRIRLEPATFHATRADYCVRYAGAASFFRNGDDRFFYDPSNRFPFPYRELTIATTRWKENERIDAQTLRWQLAPRGTITSHRAVYNNFQFNFAKCTGKIFRHAYRVIEKKSGIFNSSIQI